MDMTASIEARSDQVNADDLAGGPITYTIREVIQGKAEQPFDFMLVETDRAYRPSKTMRRVIVAAWGPDSKVYAGRRLTLYREPTIVFGGKAVGGIRISAMSHIDGRVVEKFQTIRGKRETFTVDPLAEESSATKPPSPTISAELLAELTATFDRKGIAEESRLSGANHITGGSATAIEAISEDEAREVLAALEKRPDADPALVEDAFPKDPS